MRRAQPEFELQCVVADWMRYAMPARAPWTAFPAGEARTAMTGGRLKRMGLMPGWPDIIVLFDGLFIGIELKAGKGRMSDEQAAVQHGIIENGGWFQVCRSLDEVQALLRRAGVPLKARAV